LRWNWSSLTPWFTLLLSLSVLDILTTNPNFESNPFALLMWSQFGILLSALIKIGQVLFLGVLCAGTKKIAKSSEWPFAERVMRGIMVVLVFFYMFVVVWNICMHVLRACIF
jgi:hypothetical protein